jgi:predicted esterase
METSVQIAPRGVEHTHTIIFLHGRDSTAAEFAPESIESQASDDRTLPEIFPTIKWVFPSSKLRRSERFNTEMSQWFDMWSVENPAEKEELQVAGLQESIADTLDIIRTEAALVPPERIILGGISQGCATAIHALLCSKIRLGGFIGLCSWLPFQNETLPQIDSRFNGTTKDLSDLSSATALNALNTPVFLSHSEDDEVVPIDNGRKLSESLRKFGMEVTWKAYEDGGHWINEPQGVDDIVSFLKTRTVRLS